MGKYPVITDAFRPFDDNARTPAKNGKPALAAHMYEMANALDRIAHKNRMLYTWWSHDSGVSYQDNTDTLRWVWNHQQRQHERGTIAVMYTEETGSWTDGQGIYVDNSSGTTTQELSFSTTAGATTPDDTKVTVFGIDNAAADSWNPNRCSIGNPVAANAPTLNSGLVFEPQGNYADTAQVSTFSQNIQYGAGRDVVGEAVSGSLSSTRAYREVLTHTWNRKRPSFGWSYGSPGTGTNYIEFSESSQEFRYIFDQDTGDGGNAPADDGPGVTIPAPFAGSGLKDDVSCALMVYAAMEGATDTGNIGVSHRNGGGGMEAIDEVVPNIDVNGTAYKWYPTSDTPALFSLRTDLDYDRVVLCGKSDGATDKLRIAAFSLIIWPNTNIG